MRVCVCVCYLEGTLFERKHTKTNIIHVVCRLLQHSTLTLPFPSGTPHIYVTRTGKTQRSTSSGFPLLTDSNRLYSIC